MNKEEILEKSRVSGEDEWNDFINNKADTFGFYALCIAALILSIYKSIKGLPIGDVLSLTFIFLSTGMFFRYQQDKDKGKGKLIFGVVSGMIAIVLLAIFFVKTW